MSSPARLLPLFTAIAAAVSVGPLAVHRDAQGQSDWEIIRSLSQQKTP